MNMNEALAGFSERMKAAYIFQPIVDLSRKRNDYGLSLPSLGFTILLFVLENMLHSTRNCTIEKISQFMKETIYISYKIQFSSEECLTLTRELISALRNEGKPFLYEFYDMEKACNDTTWFSLLDYEDEDGYQIKDKTVRLKLTTEGLDLLFKTKEVYQELKISITQLYLRQQIVKGVFDGALRTVQELKLQVKDLKNEIDRMKEKIRADAQRIAKEGEYKKLIDRVNNQLIREREVFLDIQLLIDHTLSNAHRNMTSKREEQTIEKITAVKRELQRVIIEHDYLLSEKLDLGLLMTSSIDESIINAFRIKLNFEREILLPFISGNGKPDFLKALLDPIFPVRVPKLFNPNKIFQKQNLINLKKNVDKQKSFDLLNEEQLKKELEQELKENELKEERIFSYIKMLLIPLLSNEKVSLSSALLLLKKLDEEKYHQIINEHDFYPTLIELHQLGELILRTRDELEFEIVDIIPKILIRLTENFPEFRNLNSFKLLIPKSLYEIENIVRLENGYYLTNFIIERKIGDSYEL